MFDYKRSYYKTYNPKLYTAKTVLWFTREEIKILKSCSRCNLWMFLLTSILIIIFLILYLTNAYPFTVSEAATVHTSMGVIFIAHSIISLLGYYAILAENSCLIDIYCAMNGILIVSDITLLVIFNHYAEGRVKHYFRNNLLIQIILVLFICINAILIPAAFVVELQVRAHGGVDRRKASGPPGGPPLGPPLPPLPFIPSPYRGSGGGADAESGLNTMTTSTSDPSIDRRNYQVSDGRSQTQPSKASASQSGASKRSNHTRSQSQPEHIVIMKQPISGRNFDQLTDHDIDKDQVGEEGSYPKIVDPNPLDMRDQKRANLHLGGLKRYSVTVHREEDQEEEEEEDADMVSAGSLASAISTTEETGEKKSKDEAKERSSDSDKGR